jgi:hypothetical protein
VSTEHGTTARGERFVSITCDGCSITMHAVGAGLARLETVLVPRDGLHHCPGCRAALGPCPPANDGDLEQLLRLSATVQIPHPEHG